MDKVGIIGLGRAGRAMAYLLAEKGYHIKAVLSKPVPQFDFILKEHTVPIRNLEEIVHEVDILLITTPDRTIGEIVQGLVKLELTAVKAVLHLSGSQAVEILKPLKEKGLFVGSLHPLQSIAELEQAIMNLPGSVFTFGGDEELLPWVVSLIDNLNCKLLVAPSSLNKNLYHAGASIVSNFLVILVKMGIDCLIKAGLSPDESQQALIPLMQGTLSNLSQLSPDKALTGPIARGDIATIDKHLQELKSLPHLLPPYQTLGELTAALALEAGFLEQTSYHKITQILKNGGSENGNNDNSYSERKKDPQ